MWMLVRLRYVKYVRGGKKEKMLALKYVKPGEAQGGPLTQTSAQPDL